MYGFAVTTNAGTRPTDNFIQVKSATKKGYEMAEEGDSINLSHPKSETRRGKVGKEVAQTLETSCNQGVVIGAIRGGNPDNPKSRESGMPTQQMLEINENGTSNALTTVQKDNVVVLNNAKHSQQRIYSTEGIAPTLCSGSNGGGQNPCKHLTQDYKIRRLTPRECFRLMDFPDSFTWPVSNTQAYKQAGNSIVVNVLAEIIKKLNL